MHPVKTETRTKRPSRLFWIILIAVCLVFSIGICFHFAKRLLKPGSQTLLIQADVPCKVNVDGDETLLARPGMISVKVEPGQHLITAVSVEENIVWEDLVYVPDDQGLVISIQLAARVAAAKQNKSAINLEP